MASPHRVAEIVELFFPEGELWPDDKIIYILGALISLKCPIDRVIILFTSSGISSQAYIFDPLNVIDQSLVTCQCETRLLSWIVIRYPMHLEKAIHFWILSRGVRVLILLQHREYKKHSSFQCYRDLVRDLYNCVAVHTHLVTTFN